MLGYLRAERLVLQTIKQRFISLASSHTFCGPSQLLSVNPLMERNAVREVSRPAYISIRLSSHSTNHSTNNPTLPYPPRRRSLWTSPVSTRSSRAGAAGTRIPSP